MNSHVHNKPAMNKRLFPALRGLVSILVERETIPRVHDEDDMRCLRFSNGVMQSAMRLADPYALDLGYTRAMMGFLLLNPAPHHVLVVGLGGGSLPKFCHRELPDTCITALEINPDVIALRDRFLIPPDDARFRVIQADAGEYLARNEVEADVILLDGYDDDGLPEGLCSTAFYSHCRRALGTGGVLVANLWGGEPNRAVYLGRLREVFEDRVWWCRPHESSSLVVLAVADPEFSPHWTKLSEAALSLDRRYRLDLLPMVNDWRRRPDPDHDGG